MTSDDDFLEFWENLISKIIWENFKNNYFERGISGDIYRGEEFLFFLFMVPFYQYRLTNIHWKFINVRG